MKAAHSTTIASEQDAMRFFQRVTDESGWREAVRQLYQLAVSETPMPNDALRKVVSDIEDRIAAHQMDAPEVFTKMRNLITYGTSMPEARLSATLAPDVQADWDAVKKAAPHAVPHAFEQPSDKPSRPKVDRFGADRYVGDQPVHEMCVRAIDYDLLEKENAELRATPSATPMPQHLIPHAEMVAMAKKLSNETPAHWTSSEKRALLGFLQLHVGYHAAHDEYVKSSP